MSLVEGFGCVSHMWRYRNASDAEAELVSNRFIRYRLSERENRRHKIFESDLSWVKPFNPNLCSTTLQKPSGDSYPNIQHFSNTNGYEYVLTGRWFNIESPGYSNRNTFGVTN